MSFKKKISNYKYVKKILVLSLKIILLPINSFINVFLTLYFTNKIKLLPIDTQLFLIYRLDFGHYLEVLEYMRYWENSRSPTALLILYKNVDNIKKLMSHICPKTNFLGLNNNPVNKIIFALPNRSYLFQISRFISKTLLKRLNSIVLYDVKISGISSLMHYNKHLDKNIIRFKNDFSKEFIDAYIKGNRTYQQKYYLKKDYYTDIITFNYSEDENSIEGDIYISMERVQENAQQRNLKMEILF